MTIWNDVGYELLRQMVEEKHVSLHLGTCRDRQ